MGFMLKGRHNRSPETVAKNSVARPSPVAISLKDVSRVYGRGRHQVAALSDINEDFHAGTFTAIMGTSGSGKSTLIQSGARLDKSSLGKPAPVAASERWGIERTHGWMNALKKLV